jgi:hypothetical protein
VNLIEALDKLFERLLKPETIIALATLVSAIQAWRHGKATKREANKIHSLVNDMTTRALGREAGDKARIAGLTGDAGDLRAAERAHQDYAAKQLVDANVQRDKR